MFAWRCGILLLLAVQANGMEAKEEPAEELNDLLEQAMSENSHDAYVALPVPLEPDEQELDDEFLAHALAESLRDTSEQELDDELLAHTFPDSSFDPYLALPVLPDPDELEGISPSEASPRREGAPAAADDGDGMAAARRGSEKIGAGEPAPPVPNPLGAFLEATQHIDVDVFAMYAQQPGLWQRLITRAWKQAARLYHPDAKGDHDRFLELTQAKETLSAWAGEFKAVKESWPHGKPHCFCDNCRRLIQQMLNCPKCLALKTNSGHDCGVFAKQFGILSGLQSTKPASCT